MHFPTPYKKEEVAKTLYLGSIETLCVDGTLVVVQK